MRAPGRAARYALVALVSVLTHLPGISSPPLDYHYHRQVNTAAVARNYTENGLRFLHPQIDWEGHDQKRAATELPVYSYLMALLWDLGGLGHLWGRVLSLIFSALAAAVLLKLLEGWIGERPALHAALFFSVIPVQIYFGRTIQPEAFAQLMSLSCLLALDAYLRGRGAAALALSWACGSLAIGHKLPYSYLLGVCALMAWARKGRAALRDPGLYAFFPLIAAAVFSWYRYASSGTYVVPTQRSDFLWLLDYSNILRYAVFQFVSRFPELSVTWPGIALWAAGWAALRGLPARTRLFLGGWFAVVCAYIVAGSGYTYHHEYTALPFAPINAALMALGLGLLRERAALSGRRWPAALLALVVAAVPVNAAFRIKHWYKISFPYLLTAKERVDAISAPGDLFLCNDRSGSAYFYFIRRKGWPHYLDEVPVPTMPLIREKMKVGAKFYLTHAGGAFADRSDPRVKPIFDSFPIAFEGDGILIFRLQGKGRARKA